MNYRQNIDETQYCSCRLPLTGDNKIEVKMKSAIVASGGGSRGSHAIGAAMYIAKTSSFYPDGFEFMTGTSVGAINTCAWAHFPPSDFEFAAQFALDIWWREVSNTRSVWKWKIPVPGLRWAPAIWSDSVANVSPLRRVLERCINPENVRESGVHVRWPATNLRTGELKVFDQFEPEIVSAVMASAAYPVLFPMVRIGEDFYSDGCLLDTKPISRAIEYGSERVLCFSGKNPKDLSRSIPIPNNIGRRGKAEIEAMSDRHFLRDVEKCLRINDEVDSGVRSRGRYRAVEVDFIFPSRELAEGMDFDGETVKRQIDLGYEDAYRYFQGKLV